jgi:hypothetical protein
MVQPRLLSHFDVAMFRLIIQFELSSQLLWRHVQPRQAQRATYGIRIGVFQVNNGGSARTPGTGAWSEGFSIRPHKLFLLLRGQFDHTGAVVRIAESCEDFAANAKVRMPLVGAFHGLRLLESQVSKFIAGHHRSRIDDRENVARPGAWPPQRFDLRYKANAAKAEHQAMPLIDPSIRL